MRDLRDPAVTPIVVRTECDASEFPIFSIKKEIAPGGQIDAPAIRGPGGAGSRGVNPAVHSGIWGLLWGRIYFSAIRASGFRATWNPSWRRWKTSESSRSFAWVCSAASL